MTIAAPFPPPPCPAPYPNARFGKSPTFRIVATDPTSTEYHSSLCGPFDLQLDANDRLMTDRQIEHHILVRLAIKRRALDTDGVNAIYNQCGDKGGWWADAWRDTITGSRLWTLEGKPPNNDNLELAKEMVDEALLDLVATGVVQEFDYTAAYDENSRLVIDPLDAVKPTSFTGKANWQWMWEDYDVLR